MKVKRGKAWILLRIISYIGEYKALLWFSLLFCIISVASTLYVPVLTGKAIDLMLGSGQVNFGGIVALLIQMGGLGVVTALAQWLTGLCNNRMTYGTVSAIRQDAFERLQRLPLSMLDEHPTGDLVSRIIADVDQFADGLLLGFTQLFTGVLTIVGTLGFMYTVHPVIATAVILITPISLMLAATIARRTFSMFARQSQIRGEQTAFIEEMITHQKVVRAFSQEERIQHQFDEANEKLANSSLKAIFVSSITQPGTRFVNALVYACVGIVGAVVSISTGGISVGQLSAFLSYANQYTKPFNEISGVVTELQNALACAKRVFDLLDEPVEMPDAPDALILDDVDGSVRFDNVSFSYHREKKLIEAFSLMVTQGQRVAIVGPTGSGKTTLINLLMRFYDANKGHIDISRHDIQCITRKSLRNGFGMVLQDTWLMSGTIRQNIAMGREDAGEDEIIAAAKATHAHSFIKRLPQGYDTLISEDGGSLSQGQKQLLCITRVMLTAPPMLILDEATSSIDMRTEIDVQVAFEKLMKGRTSFVVAHRLSTIQTADVILVMEEGRIVEKGNHRELLSKNGYYARLYHSQFES